MNIASAQKEVDNWIKTLGVRYFNELTNTAILMEELGEFSRLMARKYGEQSFKNEISDAEISEKISEELADIFFVLLCLSNQMDIDLTNAFKKSIEKKTLRDADRHKNNKKLND